jgi:predicted TIM-barrel fold metal-dependent hydrolase
MMSLPHFQFIHSVLGADRILYPIDYPYLTMAGARRFLESLPISQEDKEKIAYKNAEDLFRSHNRPMACGTSSFGDVGS